MHEVYARDAPGNRRKGRVRQVHRKRRKAFVIMGGEGGGGEAGRKWNAELDQRNAQRIEELVAK